MSLQRTPPQASRRQALRCAGAAGMATLLGPMALAQADARRDVPTPPELAQHLPQARLQGRSRFRYYGFHVYDALLWVPPSFDAARLFSQPFALSLIYARSLKARDIAERSIEEMRRQTTISEADAQRWLQAMTAAFADVRDGDRLTGLHQLDGSAVINDQRFAQLFFGIWLSSATSAPALRRDLLGV